MAEPIPDGSELNGVQRAAILVMYLEREVARTLLEHLNDDEVRQIGLAMGTIDDVDPSLIEEVVTDFVRDLHEVAVMPKSGPEFVTKVLPELLSDQRQSELMPIINRRVNREFEVFISARQPASVAAIMIFSVAPTDGKSK